MKREILFRGKNPASGKWIEGDLRTYRNGEKEILKTSIEWADGVHDAKLYPVELSSVGQYTGLKDRNGKMIFEGDILKVQTSRGKNSLVFYYREVIYNTPYFSGFIYDKGKYESKYHEVIGSIYDNPDLLKETA